MKAIKVGMQLYHGSYIEIPQISLSECIAGKDFGKGFYLTSSYDRTAATLQAYIDGVNGDPGDEIVDKNTIEVLLPNRLEDQYCFRNEAAINNLEFIKSEQVFINE